MSDERVKEIQKLKKENEGLKETQVSAKQEIKEEVKDLVNNEMTNSRRER